MILNARTICAHTIGLIAFCCRMPAHVRRRCAIVAFAPAMYPPMPPKLLVNVPMRMSTSAGSTPQCSHAPRPVAPSAPIECASSRYK